jgi:hypothetical protein
MSASPATFHGDRTTDGQGGILGVGDLEPCAEMWEDVMFELVTAEVLAEFKDCMPVNVASGQLRHIVGWDDGEFLISRLGPRS